MTCPCWSGIIQDIQTSKLAGDDLCNEPSLVAWRFEECLGRERCTSVAVGEQEHRLAEFCSTDTNSIDLRWAEGLRRRSDDPPLDGAPEPTPTEAAPTGDTATVDPGTTDDPPSTKPPPKSKHPASAKTTSQTHHPTPTISKVASPTKSSATTSTTTTESSTSTSTSTETTSTTTSTSTSATPSATAPAASATQTSSPSGSGMGPGSIAAASVFGAFAVGCVAFLAFVCTRRIKRNRESQKKESMNEQLLGGGPKSSQRSTSGSSRSIHDTESMFADRSDPAANIPLADRQRGYAPGLYPQSNNSYQQTPQYEPTDTYNSNGDYGDIGQHPSPYTTYSPPYSVPHSPGPEQYQSYRSTSATYQGQNQAWSAVPIAPIRNMRNPSTSSSHLNLPASLTPGEHQGFYPPSGYAAGGYAPQYPTAVPRSRSGS
ncbi:MAG: hypothetical protein M1840_004973 [Geoglossum simile]|nr:MAG: hypothetical protein M1840_004973 [Geoglossum simile]